MNIPASQVLQIVEDWHLALNVGNKQKLAALVQDDVKTGGPRGSAEGVQTVLEWAERASVRLTPQQYFQKQEVVVVEQLGEWLAPGTGEITGSQLVASVFTIRDSRIASIIRYNGLPEAFAASGLQTSDQVQV